MGANTNFATWDSRHYQGGSGSTTTFSFGNCRVGTTSGGYPLQYSNFAFPATGKYYIELNNIVNNNYHVFGISRQINIRYGDGLLNQTGSYQYQAWNGQKRGNGGSAAAYGSSWTSVGDVIGLAFDADNGKIWWAKNGTWQASGDPAAGSNEAFSGLDASETYYFGWADYYTSKAGTVHINCGQDSSFGNSKTSGSANATDSNGFGDFYYTPPTGFLALGSANVPVSDDIDPAQTDDEYPAKNFNTVIFTGNGGSNAVTGLGFKPDLIWGFTRDGSQDKRMIDSTRGGASKIVSNATNDEVTGTTVISAFGTDGFTANGGQFNNDNGKACGAWCWKGTGGTTSSNSDGDITSTIQANTNAGFSIVKFTSNNTANQTVGHGLGAVPRFILVKPLTGGGWSWWVYHYNNGTLGYLKLNNTDGLTTGTGGFGAHPTSSVFTMGAVGSSMPNNTSTEVISYVWADVEGSQKFGNYTGNGNADGPFIYTGFRPRMLFFKRKNSGHNWITFDTATRTFNPNNEYANWDTGSTSAQGASDKIDILSNGFKLRSTGSSFNNSGSDFVYGAWGDVPFKYNNTF